jgi:hypothetical protein
MAKATLGNTPIDWAYAVADYNRIRDMIADVIPGFADFNERLQHPAVSTWATTPQTAPSVPPRARPASPHALPEELVNARCWPVVTSPT